MRAGESEAGLMVLWGCEAKVWLSWELKSSQEGMAKIPGIPKGKILIQIIAKNYQTFGDTYDIDDDERLVEIVLKEPQSQYSVHQ